MTPTQWRKLGYRVDRTKRPMSRGVRYVVTRGDAAVGTAYSRAELDALLEGRECYLESMPGARAGLTRPARRYL